jgi:hypothetical protein
VVRASRIQELSALALILTALSPVPSINPLVALGMETETATETETAIAVATEMATAVKGVQLRRVRRVAKRPHRAVVRVAPTQTAPVPIPAARAVTAVAPETAAAIAVPDLLHEAMHPEVIAVRSSAGHEANFFELENLYRIRNG